jgi:biopolymer transport protein ExbB
VIQLRSCSKRSLDELDRAVSSWCEGSVQDALVTVTASRSPMAPVIRCGMSWLSGAGVDPDTVAEELGRMAQQVLRRFSSQLGVLEQVAYLAPLLGLLGTVLGIIDVFRGLADQGAAANAGTLAGGIWEALLTTAVGLCVAIPFALVHAGLLARIDQLRVDVENLLTRLFTAGLYKNPVRQS